jgi:hypothetical protein
MQPMADKDVRNCDDGSFVLKLIQGKFICQSRIHYHQNINKKTKKLKPVLVNEKTISLKVINSERLQHIFNIGK